MPKKFVISLLFVSLLLSQATISVAPQAVAQKTDVSELAAMLPDSDVVAAVDAKRIIGVAAPGLLGNDAKKIEHLKNLLRTVENQIGLNPSEIRQVVFGLKLPATEMVNSADALFKSDFTIIIRTANPNGELLDTWSKRIDVIAAFREEQMPTRKLMDDFREYRDYKTDKATPEKLAAVTQKFTESLGKIQAIGKTLDALPKSPINAAAVSNFRAKNKILTETINSYLTLLKIDTETKVMRGKSIALLNRWNAVTVDDVQRTAKLAGILTESKNIHPLYKQKIENARKLETFVNYLENVPNDEQPLDIEYLYDRINSDLDQTLTALAELPVAKTKKTAAINSAADILDNLNERLDGSMESLNQVPEETLVLEKPKTESFYQMLKAAEREEKVNGKRMIVIDAEKLDAPTAEPTTEAAADTTVIERQVDNPDFAVGFLDERTMVIGYERTITPFLQRDAGYKNLKALEMLGSSPNSLMLFAVNSAVVKIFTSGGGAPNAENAAANVFGTSALGYFLNDINVNGSINYDGGSVTNDVTMSVGFSKEKAASNAAPAAAPTPAPENPDADTTFEIAGYQVGKDIFYDLFNSFKAVQASVTFKFEKAKVAALIRSAPKMIDKIRAAKAATKNPPVQMSKTKPAKLKSLPDLLTAPQLYVDLAGLLKGGS